MVTTAFRPCPFVFTAGTGYSRFYINSPSRQKLAATGSILTRPHGQKLAATGSICTVSAHKAIEMFTYIFGLQSSTATQYKLIRQHVSAYFPSHQQALI